MMSARTMVLLLGLAATACGDGGKADRDRDADGVPWTTDCDDADPEVGRPGTWYLDGDGDSWGEDGQTSVACEAPAGHVARGGDCDDGDDAVFPEAEEACDGLDNDCDADIDEELETATWYADRDGDGFGDPDAGVDGCAPPAGTVADATDCDDADPAVSPAATEVCDGIDDDCDGGVDDDDDSLDLGTAGTWYLDGDGDGYGDAAEIRVACTQPSGSVVDATDCDDTLAGVNPGAVEVCDDGVDDDCDGYADDADVGVGGTTTWHLDFDGDGHGGADFVVEACLAPEGYVASADDCDDGNSRVHPGAAEVCDEVDDDCDGDIDDDDSDVDTSTGRTFYTDADGDLFGDASSPVMACAAAAGRVSDATDCDDADPGVSPGAVELCDSAGVDEDCDGLANGDDPGVDPATWPTWYSDGDGDGYGDPLTGVVACDPPGTLDVEDGTDCDDELAAGAGAPPGGCVLYDTFTDGTVDRDLWTMTACSNTEHGACSLSETGGRLGVHTSFSYTGDRAVVQFDTRSSSAATSTDMQGFTDVVFEAYTQTYFRDNCFGAGTVEFRLVDESGGEILLFEYPATSNDRFVSDLSWWLETGSSSWNVYQDGVLYNTVSVTALNPSDAWALDFYGDIESGSGCNNSVYLDLWLSRMSVR